MTEETPQPVTVRWATSADLEACFRLRREVFCGSQGVAQSVESDGRDDLCRHVVALYRKEVVGTARFRTVDGAIKVERVVVHPTLHNRGIGALLMTFAHEALRSSRPTLLVLHAQMEVVGFYGALRYTPTGDPFIEATITHQKMQRWLEPTTTPLGSRSVDEVK